MKPLWGLVFVPQRHNDNFLASKALRPSILLKIRIQVCSKSAVLTK